MKTTSLRFVRYTSSRGSRVSRSKYPILTLEYNETRKLLCEFLLHQISSSKGSVITIDSDKFRRWLNSNYSVDIVSSQMGVVWNMIEKEFKNAIVFRLGRNKRKYVLDRRKVLEKIFEIF